MTKLRYPTAEEVRAIEFAARRARNKEMRRLARIAAAAIRSLCVRAIAAISAGARRIRRRSAVHDRASPIARS